MPHEAKARSGAGLKRLERRKGRGELPPEAGELVDVDGRCEGAAGLGDPGGLPRVRLCPSDALGQVGEVVGDGDVVHPRLQPRVEELDVRRHLPKHGGAARHCREQPAWRPLPISSTVDWEG